MERVLTSKQGSLYSYSVAFFLYATLLVDLYRKLVGINVDVVRDGVYIVSLLLILYDAAKHNRLPHMLLIAGVMSLLYFLSSSVYPGQGRVYLSAWMLFITRLWPAYYVGRYTVDWTAVSRCVRKYIWIALLYAFVAYTSSLFVIEGGKSAYATISTNLFIPVWIAFYDSYNSHKRLSFVACFLCFVPVLFLGTRTCLFGALAALLFFFSRVIKRSNSRRKAAYYSVLIVGSIVLAVFFSMFSNYLLDLLPNSRTLNLLIKGDIFNDSNRSDSFYSVMFASFDQNPLKMYGLVGNQVLIAGEDATANQILSSFAHNVYLELCMNFGVIIGVLLCLYFTIVLFKAYQKSKWCSEDVEYVFLGVLGMTFVNMMLSFSWVFSYEVWLLFGMAYGVLRMKRYVSTNTSV